MPVPGVALLGGPACPPVLSAPRRVKPLQSGRQNGGICLQKLLFGISIPSDAPVHGSLFPSIHCAQPRPWMRCLDNCWGAASASLGILKSRRVFWRVLLNLTRWMDSTLFMTSSRESQLILLFVVLVSCPIATVWHLRSRPGCAPREPDHEPPSACIQDVPADSDCLGNRLMIKDLPGVWVSQFGPRSRCFFWGNLEFLVWRSRLGELGVLGVLGVLGEESELPKRGQQQSRTIGSPCRFHHCAASPPHP
jgi:hypothetical protein